MKNSAKEWAIIIGLIANLVLTGKLIFSWGEWKGTVEAQITSIAEKIDSFDRKYGNLPERVSFLEGLAGVKK